MRVGLYVRVSTTEAAKEGYSIGEQEERLRNYCKAKGWDVYHVYVDGGYSGASTDRPALQELLKDLEEGRFDAVLVYKLDRLSRSQKDTMELIEDVFLPKNIDFISMTENLDTTTPVGMAMIGLLSVFAQLERAQIAERMAIGIEGRAKKGKWHGAKFSPVGYEYKNDQLHIIEYEAMLIRKAFDMFNRRIPIGRICTEFMEAGYRHRYGYFLAASMNKMLRNPLYAGYIEKNGHLYEGQHTAIISRDTYNQAQKIIEERKNSQLGKHSFKRGSILAGLVLCKHCGAKYYKTLGKKKLDGTKSKFYTCATRSSKGSTKEQRKRQKTVKCKNKIYRMEELDRIIYEEITKLSFDKSYIEKIKENVANDNEKPRQIELINKRIAELTTQISRYSDLYSLGSIDMNEVKEKIDPLSIERQALRNQLASLESDSSASTEEAFRLAQSFGEVLENGDEDEIRFTIEELINCIVIDNDHVKIEWKFA